MTASAFDVPTPARMIIGVSLKMYFGRAQTLAWCSAVAELSRRHRSLREGRVELVVAPDLTSLAAAADCFRETPVSVAAQDIYFEDWGAFTGEVSAAQVREAGATYAEVGHAERRRLFGDSDAVVSAKVAAAVRNGLIPVLCVGETSIRGIDETCVAVIDQLRSGLHTLLNGDEPTPVVVAYEPEWAIGASEAASSQRIRAVCTAVQQWLARQPTLTASRLIYGGAAGPGLIGELGTSVDGLFLGRMVHDPGALELVLDDFADRLALSP